MKKRQLLLNFEQRLNRAEDIEIPEGLAEELSHKLEYKEEKKRYKQRTKQILLSILHKLEFINVELSEARRKNGGSKRVNRMEGEAEELKVEFEGLKKQYELL